MRLSTEEEKDAFEFNDLETDERINIDIFQFDMTFPDPKEYCLGFLVKEIDLVALAKIEEAKRNLDSLKYQTSPPVRKAESISASVDFKNSSSVLGNQFCNSPHSKNIQATSNIMSP